MCDTTTLLEFLLVIVRFSTFGVGAVFHVCEGTGECNASINSHMMFPGNDTREVLEPSFYLVIREDRCTRVKFQMIFPHS